MIIRRYEIVFLLKDMIIVTWIVESVSSLKEVKYCEWNKEEWMCFFWCQEEGEEKKEIEKKLKESKIKYIFDKSYFWEYYYC